MVFCFNYQVCYSGNALRLCSAYFARAAWPPLVRFVIGIFHVLEGKCIFLKIILTLFYTILWISMLVYAYAISE